MSESELDRRLTEIRDDVRELKGLLVGDGSEGALGRLTKLEERHSTARKVYLWLAVWVFFLSYMLVPAYFRQKWGE